LTVYACLASLILVFAFAFATPALAGKLDDFERDATEGSSDDGGGHDGDYDDSAYEPPAGAWWVLFLPLIGAEQSYERVRPGATSLDYLKPRRPGEAVIPFVRADVAYQLVESDVDAWDLRAELGYGPVAVQVRETHYDEDQPSDSLDLVQAHALLRMTIIEELELDLGIGALVVDGADTNAGFSGTIPIVYHPWDFLGGGFRLS